jgi:hypothetical protein
MDIAAAKAKVGKRKDFIKTEEVRIYPDTTVWIKDFAYSTMSQCTMIIFGMLMVTIQLLSAMTGESFVHGELQIKNTYIKAKRRVTI